MWVCQVSCLGTCSATTQCQMTLQLLPDSVWPELSLTDNATGDPVTTLLSIRACKVPAQMASKLASGYAHSANFVT